MSITLITALQTESESDSGFSPAVAGGLFLAIGLALIFFGVRGLRSGSTKDKFGIEYSGGKAKLISGTRVGLGIFLIGAGIYRIVTG